MDREQCCCCQTRLRAGSRLAVDRGGTSRIALLCLDCARLVAEAYQRRAGRVDPPLLTIKRPGA